MSFLFNWKLPAGPWGWVYGKELSSFVFYTGTRSIRNDAHGRKNSDHQSTKDRVPLLHYTIDGRAKSTNAPAKLSRPLIWGPNCSVRRPSQGQLGGCLTVGQAPQIVSFHENMVGECLCRLWEPAGTESNHGSCMFHEANGRFQAQCACKGPLSSLHQPWQTFIQMHPCLYMKLYEIRVLSGATYIGRSQYRPIGQMTRISQIIVDIFTAPNSSSVLRTASNAPV